MENSLLSVEQKEYWLKRPIDDKRRDWRNGAQTWLDEYLASASHPHRQLIVNAVRDFRSHKSVLEIGCNVGPNLLVLRNEFPQIGLNGIDINNEAIEYGKTILPEATLIHWEVKSLPFSDKSVDIVLADAVLMYVPPNEILQVFNEIDRVTRHGVIIVDWFDRSYKGIVKDGHWARNYAKLLRDYHFETKKTKLTMETWPNERWASNGYVFVGKRKRYG